MLRHRYSACATVAVAVSLSLLISCSPESGDDDDKTGVDSSPVSGDDISGDGALPGQSNPSGFVERWESSALATYSPGGLQTFKGDAGNWLLVDTASNVDNCSPSPHTGEVIMHRGSKALRLTSNESPCVDNISVSFTNDPVVGNDVEIPISPSTQISFYEEGAMQDPQRGSSGCGLLPCGDHVSVRVADTRGNLLVYMLQRAPDAAPRSESFYLEIFLDPDAGNHQRNLYDDFSQIPLFNPSGAKVRTVGLAVSDHGWAIIDDLVIMGDPTMIDGPQIPDAEDALFDSEVGRCNRAFASLDETYLKIVNKLDVHIDVHISSLNIPGPAAVSYSGIVNENSCDLYGLVSNHTVDVTITKCDSGDYEDDGFPVDFCGFGRPEKTTRMTPTPGVTVTVEVTDAYFPN